MNEYKLQEKPVQVIITLNEWFLHLIKNRKVKCNMKKTKKVLAIIMIIFLVGLYIVTLIAAITSTPATAGLFKASLFCTMVLPIMLYIYQMVYKVC